jgi:hypothetical protein
LNGANDSNEQKREIKNKFKDDLLAALTATPKPQVFIFLTNANLTVGEKDALIAEAKAETISYCEIFDRERIRIALDEPDGFSIRFQYLGLAMSPEEQASFFAKWGDDIQSLVTNGFQRLEATIDRVLFLQEATDILSSLYFQLELDREYPADEIGHFRAFCYLHLVEPKHKIFQIAFGSSDRASRFRGGTNELDVPGIKHGISGQQWENYLDINEKRTDEEDKEKFVAVGGSSSIGMDPVRFITMRYYHDGGFIRLQPRLQLLDFDRATYLLMLNRSLAEKVKAIHVSANGYKVDEYLKPSFNIDPTEFKSLIPATFSAEEMTDPWVRIRPANASAFSISFSSRTPRRLFSSPKTPHSLDK